MALDAFTVLIKPTGGDYNSISGFFDNVACDLTAASTLVFMHSLITGTMSDGTAVTGLTSGATGTCQHCSSNQILISGITGTFQTGEIVYETLGTNFVTILNTGYSAYVNVVIDGTWTSPDTSAFFIGSPWVTSSTNYISVSTTQVARHKGIYNSSTGYAIEVTNTNAIVVTVPNVFISGLQVKVVDTSNYNYGIVIDSGATGNIFVSHCIFVMNPASGMNDAAILTQNVSTSTFYNNLVYSIGSTDSSQNGVYAQTSGTVVNFYNNTFIGFATNLANDGNATVNLYNNISQYGGTGDYTGVYATKTDNISKDATGNIQATLTFVNAGSGNYNLASGDTAAQGAGINGSGIFTDDIVSYPRKATGAWDLGAFAYFTGTLLQTSFLFRNDDGSETTATSIASQGNNINRNENVNTRVRVLINTTGSPGAQQFQLEWQKVQSGNTTWTKAA